MSGTYREAPRSYAGLLYFVALLVLGFVLDMIFGGGVAHLLGWGLALVLVVGLNFVVIYAVRSEKSLELDADALRVGDQSIARMHIVGAVPDPQAAPVQVLGWPQGAPRGLHGLTVRLADGHEVLIPTRHPERLRAALGLVLEERPEVAIRAATRAELRELPEIDQRAESIFRAAGYALPELPLPANAAEPLRHAKAVFVAGRPPVGFVWVDEVDGLAHVHELAVLPKWMKQGIGSRLLERACEWARDAGYSAITLTTYADVPWNGPFYARRGFAETPASTPGLHALRANETELGLDEIGRRIVMRRELAPAAATETA